MDAKWYKIRVENQERWIVELATRIAADTKRLEKAKETIATTLKIIETSEKDAKEAR
jgi:hypothetical protein